MRQRFKVVQRGRSSPAMAAWPGPGRSEMSAFSPFSTEWLEESLGSHSKMNL